MDDDSDSTQNPPDWSQLSALWPEQDSSTSSVNTKSFNDYMDFNMSSGILDMDMDMGLSAIEPSALHLDSARLSYGGYDDPFAPFPSSASPADILAAQFPFTFPGDTLMDTLSGGVDTPSIGRRRLSVTSSSSSSGPSFSPAPESVPSPEYISSGNGYTSDSTQSLSTEPVIDPSLSADQVPAAAASATATNAQSSVPDHTNDPAAELAWRVRQTAGVILAVPMNSTSSQSGQFVSSNGMQTKLPIPRLQRPSVSSASAANSPPKSSSPSAISSAASTPPPSTPPSTSNDVTDTTSISASISSSPSISPQSQNSAVRPKTSHTTIERRYRTNLNARIQSLRMAVPALRVLEDRGNGSSKKIKKNLKGGVLIKSASPNSPNGVGTVIAVPGEPTPSNPYGEVDVIDERGYVDGVKVARKCSKANVLGKAVEYIRVLKRRETRLRAEQAGLKTLVCGLVGGPALLGEWEREWRERFGGEEKDEVDGEGDVEDEGDEDEDEEDEDEEGEAGRKRKRAKSDKDTLSLPKKEAKSSGPISLNADGQPEKRKRGRPRKVQTSSSNPAPVTSASASEQPPQQQQYLLAAFALFSFFNSPLTSSNKPNYAHTHAHKGHVLSHSPVPLAYAPEIISQFTLPASATATWQDWVQVAHLIITVLLFLSVISKMAGGFGFGRIRRLMKVASGTAKDVNVDKKVERMILGAEPIPSFGPSLTLYRSLSNSASPVLRALFLFSIASTPSSSPSLVRRLLQMRARSIWDHDASAFQQTKTGDAILSVSIDEAYNMLSSLPSQGEDADLLVDLATHIVNSQLSQALAKMFVREVGGGKVQVQEEPTSDLGHVIEAAKELGGDVGFLAKNIERVSTTSSIPWSASTETSDVDSDGEEDWDSSTSLSQSIASEEDLDDDEREDEIETNRPFTLLRALMLYRSIFSAPPVVFVEPPTPTTATPTKMLKAMSGTHKRMYALRKLLGSRVFDVDEVEDARDKVVDMLVEAERKERVKSTMLRV